MFLFLLTNEWWGDPSVGGGGFAASPAGTAPLYYKSAEIASGSAKNLCKKSEDVGGVCPARHRLDLPLWKTQWGACPDVAGAAGVSDTRRGACPVGRLPTLPLACCLAPYPPNPLPRRGRGRPRLFHARGFAPCIPATEPARHWFALPLWKTQWGACPGVAGAAGVSDTRRGACPVGRLPTLPLACFPAPYPPTPLPRRGRGCPKVYFAGGFAPGTPALNRLLHLQNLPSRYPKWGFASCEAGLRRRSDTLRRCAFGVASSAQNR